MIIDRTPLDFNESEEIIKNLPESKKKEIITQFLEKFNKTKPEQAKRIKEELQKLDSIKIKQEHIVKITDLLPKDSSDINKIFTDVSLNEDETNKILEIIKNTK